MATPPNFNVISHLNSAPAVRAFLTYRTQVIRVDEMLCFKVHEDNDEWFIVNAEDRLLALTDKETTLYFLLAYNLPKLRQDEKGYQYFELGTEVLSLENAQPGVREALLIARNITEPLPSRRRRKR